MSIHIGTSGWSYKDWKGKFYPPRLPSGRFLPYYATHFDTTEINSSFYRLPQKETIEKWLEQVPSRFYFCAKMSRYLTHLKKLRDFEEPLSRFFERFDIMHQRMGPVLLQLPANLAFDPETVLPLYQYLRSTYSDYRFAVEARHASWFTDTACSRAAEYGISLVIAQSAQFPYHEKITARDIYIRFHGPDKLYGSSYKKTDLEAYAEKIRTWNKEGHEVWVFFNNDMYGHATDNARALLDMT